MKKLLVILFIIGSFVSFGQDEKVVLTNGKEIFGEPSFTNQYDVIIKNENGDKTKIDNSNVDLVYLKPWNSRKDKDKVRIFKFIKLNEKRKKKSAIIVSSLNIDGLSLFWDSNPEGRMYYYLLRPNEKYPTSIVTSAFSSSINKKVAAEYFSDCPAIVEKIEDKTYKKPKTFEDLVDFYNKNCN